MQDEKGFALEFVNCDNCGSKACKKILSTSDFNYGVPGTFTIVKCDDCQLIYQNPMPSIDSFNQAYPDNYGPHIGTDKKSENKDNKPLLKEMIKEKVADNFYFQNHGRSSLSKYALIFPFFLFARITGTVLMPTANVYKNKLLDIGCGTGNFLSRMNNLGWDVYGIEPDNVAAKLASKRFSGRIVNDYFKPGVYEEKSFDLITMWHVIEHLPSPSLVLGEIERLLKPGGWLIIMTPNIRSIEYWIFRKYYYPLDLPRHLYHYSPRTLKNAVKKSRLLPLRILHGIEPQTWIFSLRNFYRVKGNHNIKLNQAILHYLAVICSLISVLLRSASTITIYAQKPVE